MNVVSQFLVETGWFRLDGAVADSTAATVSDPTFLAVRIENLIGLFEGSGSLPPASTSKPTAT